LPKELGGLKIVVTTWVGGYKRKIKKKTEDEIEKLGKMWDFMLDYFEWTIIASSLAIEMKFFPLFLMAKYLLF